MRGPLPPHPSRRLLVLIFLVAAVCCLARLGSLPLVQPDEGRNAEVAREMKDAGEWLVPTYDGLPYLDKPALYFRFVALSLSAFGENETAARLPAAGFALALLALLYAFSRREYGERAAALAVLVVGTTPLVIAFARIVIFDMVLAFFVTAAILAGYVAEEKEAAQRARWYLVGAACSAVATLVKGPVGFILPILVLAVFNAVDRRAGATKRLFAPLSVLVFLAIVLPWFFGLAFRRPDFPYYGLVEESLHRFTSAQFHRTAPFWYYVPVIAAVFFPWSVLLPESVLEAWKRRDHWLRADRLLVVWGVVVVLFFSISQSKLPGYVLTAVVALGVLTARVLDLAFQRPDGPAGAVVIRGVASLAVIAAAATAVLGVATTLRGGLPALLHLRSGEFQLLGPATAPLLWSLAVVGLAAAAAAWRRSLRVAVVAFALPPLLLLTVAWSGVQRYAEADSSRRLVRSIPPLPPSVELACLECLPNGLPFYLKRTITIVTRDGDETTSNYAVFVLKRSTAWPAGVVRLSSLGRWLAWHSRPVYLLANRGSRAMLDSIAVRHNSTVFPLADGWWGALVSPPEAP